MKKLIIVFTDKSKVVYTIKDFVRWEPYFERHSKSSIESAIVQQYPKKNFDPMIIV